MSKAPICPQCDVQMVLRRQQSTRHTFYGCPNWPDCEETASTEDEDYGEEE